MNINVFLLILTGSILPWQSAMSDPIPEIFDGHIHYSSDVWDSLPPQRALEMMTAAGITRAMVSGTPGEGAERLYLAAPERVVPFLRPYARPEHRQTWSREAAIMDYVHEQLARIPYRGIGEFHLSAEDARNPVVSQIITLARERGLALHAHTDRAGIQVLLDQAPDIPVIWAHGGFDVPEIQLRELLANHKQLFIELSFRAGITEDGKLTPVWAQLFSDFHTRFLVGMDTYTPQRWVELAGLAAEARKWLLQLPEDIAQDIASGNAARLFPVNKK